jgi:hypothetical protein
MALQLINRLPYLYIFFTILACGQSSTKDDALSGSFKDGSPDSCVIDTLFCNNDTIVMAYLVGNGKGAILKWGITGAYLNTGVDTLPYSDAGFGMSYKEKNYYAIKDGCGSGCNYLYLMRFSEKSKGRLMLSPLLLDFKMSIVIYQGGNSEVLAIIEDFETGLFYKIEEEFDKTQRPYSLAIDTMYLEGEELKIFWFENGKKKVSKSIDLKEVLSN